MMPAKTCRACGSSDIHRNPTTKTATCRVCLRMQRPDPLVAHLDANEVLTYPKTMAVAAHQMAESKLPPITSPQ